MTATDSRSKRRQAAEVGLVLGAVFVIMGIAYGNRGIWMPGVVVLAVGLYARWGPTR